MAGTAAGARNQVTKPSQFIAQAGTSTSYDFSLWGVTAGSLQVTDSPGTLVLITTYTITSASPPTIGTTSGPQSAAYSKTIDSSRKVQLSLPMGSYYITCWKPTTCGNKTVYLRSPATTGSSPVHGGNALQVQASGQPNTYSASCSTSIDACPVNTSSH